MTGSRHTLVGPAGRPDPGLASGAGGLVLTGQDTPVRPGTVESLDLARWHLDRVDGLRASTVSMAAAVLSAAAVLLAGNALVFGQVGDARLARHPLITAGLAVGLVVSTSLVVVSMACSAGSLTTLTRSGDLYQDPGLPPGLVFSGSETLRLCPDYATFNTLCAGQTYDDMLQAARVALWVGIGLHRRRHAAFRRATRVLYWAAAAWLTVLTAAATALQIP